VAIAAAVASLVAAAAVSSSARGRDWAARMVSRCGNGAVEAGEECDDGNQSDTDGCLTTCRFATCGDGQVRLHVEECDDGNHKDGDGCNARCLRCQPAGSAFTWSDTGHCYSRHDVSVTWAEARDLCLQNGGDLATFTSGYEVLAADAALLRGDHPAPWVGLWDREGTGHYEWVTGESTGSGESVLPLQQVPAGTRRCAVLAQGRLASHHLHPIHLDLPDCNTKAAALCEQPGWVVNPTDHHAYLVISRPASWQQARLDCVARGGHLATIGGADEQSFVATHTFETLWIGGSDLEREADFRWITGEPFQYGAFVAKEPDDPNGNADCLMIGLDKGWHDRICNESSGYVCEIE
jgi:cysteine-rich repeat protein